MDGYLLDRAPSGLARIDDIVRNTVHPADDVARRALWRVEDNWYYVVFLQALCRYLHLLVEEGIHDGRFCYARDSLLTYADWMLEHEAPYLEKPEILEFPNHTWTAQDLRKANVLYEASRWAPENALAYKQRASEFVDHVATTLREEPTRHYTRIQALLLQNLSPSARPPRASGHSVPPRQSYPAPALTGPVGQVRRLAGLALRALWHLDPAEELRALRRLLQP